MSRFGDYRLRGCIGTLQPKYLHTALREYALTRWVSNNFVIAYISRLACKIDYETIWLTNSVVLLLL